MKKILVILVLAAMTVATARPVKSSLGAENAEYIQESTWAPTAADYIQDGLIAIWDGIENAGWGVHDDTAKTWVNLVNGDYFSIGNNNYFTEDSLITTAALPYQTIQMYGIQDEDAYTLEATGASLAAGKTIVNLPYTDRGGGVGFAPYVNWNANNSYIKACGGNMSINNSGPVGTRKSFGVRVEGNSYMIYSVQFDAKKTGTWTKSSNTYKGTIPANVEPCCIRMYNRALTDEEIAWNYLVDKLRFNLQ